jgi:hypothetical protein
VTQANGSKVFLSDKTVSLLVKGTFKIGTGEAVPLKENLVIEVLK